MSSVIALELLQSVGVEIAIFAITLTLAAAFHGFPLRGKTCCAVDKPKSVSPRSVQTLQPQRSKSPSLVRSPVAPPSNPLSKKIRAIVDCGNWRRDDEALALYEEMKANGDHANIKQAMVEGKQRPVDLFSLLVQCAGRVGRPELIEVLLADMEFAGIARSLAFYESTMKMLASKKCYKEAMCVCSCLEADGLEPSPVTLSCLINFAVESGESQRAIGFFSRLAATSTPSIRAYMTVFRLHSRSHDWASSLALLRDMQTRGAPIDSLVLNIVLATGIGAHQLDSTQDVLREFSELKITDVVSYNTVMKGFAQKKEVDRAISLLKEMRQTSVKPNAITFNTVMDAAVRSSRIEDAWRLLADMGQAGLSPDKFTCTTLTKGLQNGVSASQLVVILDLLKNVIVACDSALCGALFRSVIEAAAQVNEPALTAKAVAEMREQRGLLSSQDYSRLLQILLGNGGGSPCRSVVNKHPEAMRPVRAF